MFEPSPHSHHQPTATECPALYSAPSLQCLAGESPPPHCAGECRPIRYLCLSQTVAATAPTSPLKPRLIAARWLAVTVRQRPELVRGLQRPQWHWQLWMVSEAPNLQPVPVALLVLLPSSPETASLNHPETASSCCLAVPVQQSAVRRVAQRTGCRLRSRPHPFLKEPQCMIGPEAFHLSPSGDCRAYVLQPTMTQPQCR